MSKEKQLCVKIIFILVDIWMFLQMRSVEFREKTSGDSHRNTMEGLSQDKNGRRALLNKQIHEVSLLSPLVVHKRHGFIHITVVNMIFLPQFMTYWTSVFKSMSSSIWTVLLCWFDFLYYTSFRLSI